MSAPRASGTAAPQLQRPRLQQHVALLIAALVVVSPPATSAFVFPTAPGTRRASSIVLSSSSSSSSSNGGGNGSGTDSDRRGAVGRLLYGGVAAAAAAAAATTTALPRPAAAAATKAKKAAGGLAPYPAKVTDKAYLDVRITGFVTGEEKATNEEFTGRVVVGLFGQDAPLAVQEFKKYAAAPYGGDEPSYAYSAFVKADPGVSVTAGKIKGLKELQIAGTREYEWFDRVLGAKGLDEPKDTLRHDRKGLLTKAREQDAVDSVFDITLGPCPERDGRATVFGIVLEGLDVLGEVASVPVYTMEAAGGQQPEALDSIFVQQKKLFLNVAKSFGDERAVDRQGSFLKRVEIIGSGVL